MRRITNPAQATRCKDTGILRVGRHAKRELVSKNLGTKKPPEGGLVMRPSMASWVYLIEFNSSSKSPISFFNLFALAALNCDTGIALTTSRPVDTFSI